jgi:predicted O-methyltransferase YrrM
MLQSRSRCWHNQQGYTEVDMTGGLIELCSKWIKKEMVGVEVGSFAGASSEVLAYYCRKLVCVDPWAKSCDAGYTEIPKENIISAEKEFDLILQKYNNIRKIIDFSLNACSFFANEILDFVYIDGAHDYNSAYKDIVSWKSKVKKGGLLMGHDEYAIKKALKDAGIIVVEVFKDSSWVSIVD